MLEVVVPLVYRPAMKAAFLDLGTAGTTAKVLSLFATGFSCARKHALVRCGEECDAVRANHGAVTAHTELVRRHVEPLEAGGPVPEQLAVMAAFMRCAVHILSVCCDADTFYAPVAIQHPRPG